MELDLWWGGGGEAQRRRNLKKARLCPGNPPTLSIHRVSTWNLPPLTVRGDVWGTAAIAVGRLGPLDVQVQQLHLQTSKEIWIFSSAQCNYECWVAVSHLTSLSGLIQSGSLRNLHFKGARLLDCVSNWTMRSKQFTPSCLLVLPKHFGLWDFRAMQWALATSCHRLHVSRSCEQLNQTVTLTW